MEITIRVQKVGLFENGGGWIDTVDDAGEGRLYFSAESHFEEITALNGCELTLTESVVKMGEVVIAHRLQYGKIKFIIKSFQGIEMRYYHSPIAQVV